MPHDCLAKYDPASAMLCPESISGYVTWPGYRIELPIMVATPRDKR
jgi:hypothetical protein